jgi:hypothetical protein
LVWLAPQRSREERCIAYNSPHSRCLCLQQCYPLFDHTHIWLDPVGRHVLTSEPRDADALRIAELTEQMADLGITVTVGDCSPTLLLFTAA